ncbi:hypothetical protein H7J87_11785 [Mycolicibacterium wolinskyi]|uniref:Uncharacterized protein n=1 Tax=Mycolicibacterium wolinskyi TaxID=59750 RepID=A0A1X2FKD4_9MYCO|nr:MULTISPECIES: hypothetical protein [Mycolicibacterium]MCV7286011.1 hypothetical protein [Mycolicibacterium wolinskyi]MCV7296207.1 hypothetical protein [Mycolicibacterium goodii]ORX18439.1 hypothetical protein AWC31_14140 [Mycolicibacterium wolinskyi]
MRGDTETDLGMLGRAVSSRVFDPRRRRYLLTLLAMRPRVLLARSRHRVVDGLATDDARGTP